MVMVLIIISRFFISEGGFCGRITKDYSKNDESMEEIQSLRDEIRASQGKEGKEDMA
jgi:hypothetical protein